MKIRSQLIFTTLLSISFSHAASAYPIFYKCDAKRHMSDVLTGNELAERLKSLMSLSPAEQAKLITSYCDGYKECETQLKQIVQLAKINQAVAEKIFAKELNELYAKAPSKPIHELDSKSFELRKKIEDGAFEVAACRNTISRLPIENFTKDGKALVYYPHYTEYTYVTGCRNYKDQWRDGWSCYNGNSVSTIQDAIKKSLSMGVDPYTFLAIGLMEGGSGGWQGLYLDPIGEMGVLGCTEIKSDEGKAGDGKLYSYGNYHKILPGLIQNDQLAGDLKKYLTSKSEAVPGTSYFCRNVSSADTQILEKSDPSQCCLKLGFAPTSMSGRPVSDIEEALVVKFVGKTQFHQMNGKTDPAFRIQGFNGFSTLMGGAESVSNFRSGVNYYETPTYGYQGMDFILNSLVSNPWLKKEIEEQSKEMGVNSPSILCMDVAVPGTFQIDSDYYFKRHRDAPRMKSLQGRSWESMTSREKKVLNQEISDPEVKAKIIKKFGFMPTMFPSTGTGGPMGGMGTGGYGGGLSVNSTKGPDGTTYKITVNQKTGTPTYEKIGPQNQQTTFKDYKEFFKASNEVFEAKKAEKGVTIFVGGIKEEIKFSGGFDPKPLLSSSLFGGGGYGGMGGYGGGSSELPQPPYKTTYSDGIVCSMDKAWQSTCVDKNGKKVLQAYSSSTSYKVEWPDGKGYSISIKQIQPAKEAMLVYFDGTMVTQSSEEIADPNEKKPAIKVTPEQVVAYYFSDIYPTRSTVAKASPLPWGDLPNDALQAIISKVNPDPKKP